MHGAKKLIFEQFALVGQALSNGHRLELLDLLVQGECSVDALARAAGLTLANASQHLAQLRRAGMVTSRRDGKRVIYALSDPQVWDLVRAVRGAAERNLAEVDHLVRQYYTDRDSLEPVSRDELRARVAAGSVLVLDAAGRGIRRRASAGRGEHSPRRTGRAARRTSVWHGYRHLLPRTVLRVFLRRAGTAAPPRFCRPPPRRRVLRMAGHRPAGRSIVDRQSTKHSQRTGAIR